MTLGGEGTQVDWEMLTSWFWLRVSPGGEGLSGHGSGVGMGSGSGLGWVLW